MRYEVIHGDCLDILPTIQEPVECIFADPPDNIGLGYGEYPDSLPTREYIALLERWTRRFIAIAKTTWISFNPKWTVQMGVIASKLMATEPDLAVRPMVQTFTFGQHRATDFGTNHRPLWRFQMPGAKFLPEQIRVESWRQANGDKRADPRGRVPGDVFDFTRVTGNSKQRRPWHPTQLNEGLVERCILSCTVRGDLVVDPFAGTGTTLRVCRRIGRDCITMDVDKTYCRKILIEIANTPRSNGEVSVGDNK